MERTWGWVKPVAAALSLAGLVWLGIRWLRRRKAEPYACIVQAPGRPSEPYGYRVPVAADAPWPTFRRDQRNTGRSTLPAVYAGDRPWAFHTGKGIFSTPVIDGRGTIYVGSADHFFYALNPDGSLKWKFETGEIIDSAAALGRAHPDTGDVPVTFISGDGHMYHFRTSDGIDRAGDRLIWRFRAERRPGVSFNNWFEGNVAIGPDGTLYAGNTNFNYYAVNPDGTLKWVYSTGSNNWSQAAFAGDGTIFWGSLDTCARRVAPDGSERWRRRTLGFIAASAALGSDGTVYIGSFDSHLYALDAASGKVRWKFATGDHIYSSAALGAGAAGNTSAIYFGSADGMLYALRPDGSLLWKYDAGDPIRSSPAIGLAPSGGEIVYFGAGNGVLYAVNAADGSLRWAFDTTPDDPELADRNDLNGSPALGMNGVYIGGEHGDLWYVPYDYPLHAASDPRCRTAAGDELPGDFAGLCYVTPGGTTRRAFPATLPSSGVITLRLVVRERGETIAARLWNNPIGGPRDALSVTADPPFPARVEHSADGRYLFIRPQGLLAPGTHTLRVRGRYYSGGLRVGNLALGGRERGRFDGRFSFRVETGGDEPFPLRVMPDETAAFEWTRLAAPLPTMLPSLNQIGFDYIDWIAGTVVVAPRGGTNEGKAILWAIGGKRDASGRLVADPASDFTLPLSGRYRGEDFILVNRAFKMAITGISIPFNLFELRGQLRPDLSVKPGASTYADTQVLSIPKFGPYLVIAGLANGWCRKLLVAGTYITRPYPADGPANRRPAGIAVTSVDFRPPSRSADGWARATFSLAPGATYPLAEHRPGILLVDEATTAAVSLDYHAGLTSQADATGGLRSTTLRIPRGTRLPARLTAYVMLDVFPVHKRSLMP